ncbi:hypothetical protein [Aequorivita xiaoshiensis]|uniref:Uncharacterized protein n=1 Tax=Aequorivita xiaoshiensis TaxID=2874476 RepID=A0A9X1R5W5_9FLAO|nr:hypothetical protein [Aequorivita xiaoshiensis]MCG2431589.1 hypothetical protein [Aequorivita xiaoshiensis]
MKAVFKEEQRFSQWWLWLILIGIGALPIIAIYQQIFNAPKLGDSPISALGLIVFSLFIFGLIALFWFMRLKTNIDQNEIRMSFFPFVKKQVNWKDVKSAQLVNYGFVGGWGLRLGTKYGTVYNTKGNRGLAIELLNGKKFLIGTQKETELREILAKIKK